MSTHKLLVLFGTGALAAVPTRAHALDVTVGQIVRGGSVDFDVSGAAPGSRVYLLASTVEGNGPCPPALGGLCLDLVAPTILGSDVASAGGVVRFTRAVPAGAPLGEWVFQVVHGGAQPAVSAPAHEPVLQILAGELIVVDAATHHEAQFTLEGDLELSAGTYPASVVLPYLERGAVAITRLDLDEVELAAWVEGSLLVGPSSLVATDPAPHAAVRAPVLERLIDLDAWAWDVTDLELPSLAEVGAIRLTVVGQPDAPANLRFPLLQAVSGGSLRGLLGLDFASPAGREVTVDLGAFDGLSFGGGGGLRIGEVPGVNRSDLDLRLGGNVRLHGASLQRLPGFLRLEGERGFRPWIEAPRLTEIGSYEDATGGVSVIGTGWTTLTGLLPGLSSTGRFELFDNLDLTEVGLVGVQGLRVATVEIGTHPALIGWTPERSGWAADTFVEGGAAGN